MALAALLLALAVAPPAAAETVASPDEAAGGPDAGPDTAPRKPFRLEIASPDGRYRMRFGLVAQAWLRYREDWQSTAGPSSRDARVEFRRIRLVLSGNAFTRDFSYKLQLSVLPGQFEMLDLYGDYSFTPALRLRFGVWKIPFSRFRTRSFADRQLVDWPVITQVFGAERQIGIALHDGYSDRTPPPFEWAFGVFSGVNTRTSHGVGAEMLFGVDDEVEPVPIHPEIVARVGYNHRGIDTKGEGDLEGGLPDAGPFRFAVHLSAAWDLQPTPGQDWAIRTALEGLMKVSGYSLSLGGYLATIQDGPLPAHQIPGAVGLWAGTGYVIGRRVEVVGQYALIRPLDRSASIHEPRIGLDVFILGRRVQWRTDVGAQFSCDEGDDRADVEIRSLIQMSI